MSKRPKGEYALMWANGATFGEIYDLMEAEIYAEFTSPVLVFYPPDEDIDDWGEG